MQEPAGQTWLQRILNYRFFGKPREMPAKRDFDTLSHSEQQEAMLWGERSWAGIPVILATFLPVLIYTMGFPIGMSLIIFLSAIGSPLPQTFDTDERTLMYQLASVYTVSIAVVALLVLYSENPARWLVRRWPKKFADMQDPAVRKQLKQINTALKKYGLVAILLLFLSGAYIDGLSGLLFHLSFTSPLILMIWFVHRGATRYGIEPCCRKCGYSLPLEDSLPEHCSECGIELTEPWGRVLGQSRRKGLWWVYFGLLMLLPVAMGAALWTYR